MHLRNIANLPPDELAKVQAEVAGHNTTEGLLKWGFAQDRRIVQPQVIADLVIQDEYSHDLIVPWRDGLVLVYGAT